MSTTDEEPPVTPVGVVPVEDSRAFGLLHGESLVAVACWALGEAGVTLLDFSTGWEHVQASGAALVLHDPLCPATPVSFLESAISTSASTAAVVAGVRPVTDTVKRLDDGVVGATVDRSTLVAVTSPVVLPPAVVASLPGWPDLTDVPTLVAGLRERYPVTFVEAPAEGRRVADESDLRLLEALTAQ